MLGGADALLLDRDQQSISKIQGKSTPKEDPKRKGVKPRNRTVYDTEIGETKGKNAAS